MKWNMIISKDIEIQQHRNGECKLLEVLSIIFNKKKVYYKGNKGNWNVNHMSGLPEVRHQMADKFRVEMGFARLYRYMLERTKTPIFPSLEILHQVLSALTDSLPNRSSGADQPVAVKEMEDTAIDVSKATMMYVDSCSDDALKKLSADSLNTILHDLQRIFDRMVPSRRKSTYEFYAFWRGIILKLITSQSLPLKLLGWQQIDDLLEACSEHRPPPREFEASSAGCSFVNGTYIFAGRIHIKYYRLRNLELRS